ncbi:MAG: LamG-like jellyroll fold domain-containing protein, partial [Verrucomicrobiota bacterium]
PSVRHRVNVTLPAGTIDLGANGTNYTLEAWVKLPTRLINERMVLFRTAGPGPRVSFSIAANRTLHTTIFGTQDIGSSVRIPNDNRWHHIAVVCEDFSRLHFHLDGVRMQTVNRTGTGAASSSGSPSLLIGMESDTRYFKGLLDRVRIHNTALTPEQLDYPARPGLPRITMNPSDMVVDPATTVSLEAAGTSSSPATYAWRYRASRADLVGTDLPNSNATTLTLNNVTVANEGFYSLVIRNDAGEVESYSARVTVRTAPGTLQPLWTILPGERDYITGYNNTASLRDLERGLAYNPTTDHLLVVARANSTDIRKIAILDAAAGSEVGELKTTGISGGTFPLSRIAVADDGAIYAANFGSTSGTTSTSFLRVYRWADESAEPTTAYVGNPVNAQYGKNLTVRGSGANTQILLETRGTFVVMLVTTDGVNFNPVIVQTDARSDDFSLGTAFGDEDTFWGKNQFEPLYQWEFDLATRSGKLVRTYADLPTEHFSNFSFSNDGKWLAGLNVNPNGADTVDLYDLSDLNRGPVLVDTAAFTVDNPNAVFGGKVVIAGNRVFALNSNNGIRAFTIGGSEAPALDFARNGTSITLTWPASAAGFVLESADQLPGANWTVVPFQTQGDVNTATVTTSKAQQFFRLRK